MKLTFGVFTAPCLVKLNKKYNTVSEVGFEPTPTYVDLINDLRVSLDNFLILDIQYLKLTFGVFAAPYLFILNKKYNMVSKETF